MQPKNDGGLFNPERMQPRDAERYEIKECELDVLVIDGPEGTLYIDGEEIEARVIRQLRADLAAVTAERDRLALLQQEAIANEIDRDEELQELRAQLAEYVEAPAIAFINTPYPYVHRVAECDEMPPIGTELIARKVKK